MPLNHSICFYLEKRTISGLILNAKKVKIALRYLKALTLQYPNLLIKRHYIKSGRKPSLQSPQSNAQLIRLFWIFIGISSSHTVAMMCFEGLSFSDSLWLTLSTITTVGYGDLSAKTDMGRATTIILIYMGGITLLAELAAEYIEHRLERTSRKLKGRWEWKKVKDHIVIINTPIQDSDRYLSRLIHHVRNTPDLEQLPIQILSNQYPDGLPSEIREQSVSHYHAKAETLGSLEKVNIDKAKFVLIIARNYSDSVSDSISFDILDRIKASNSGAYIVCEVVNDENRERFIEHGANSTIRPIRAYPEIITRAFDSPGTEKILENLFTHQGDHPHRYNLSVDNIQWAPLACQIVNKGLGTLLAYIDINDQVVTNPEANTNVTAKALIVLVRENFIPSQKEIEIALSL